MTIDYQVLREAAEKATPDEWVAFISPGTGTYAVHTPGDKRCGDVIKWPGFDGQENAENNARYVAAFNPKVALELLGEIKRLEDTNIDAMCRIAELETNLAALVAENAGLKHAMAVTLEHVSVTDAGQAGVAAMIINDALHHSETPATDAFLSEVRAQGVDAAIEAAKNLVAQEYEYKDFKAAQSDCCMHPGSDLVGKVEMTEWLVDFAAQLRKGGNQ
ncbi:ead/Ea22-like family protein [Salmonella enterica]|nr:ead/Ea22-like family protein [Salmonella enterica subsp. enterica serovar Derby]EKB8767786.1 ead/Ea22-like family protein [Salmonella enterica]EMD4026752.1 ead/Ea22-like family protein [Escherichia coli]